MTTKNNQLATTGYILEQGDFEFYKTTDKGMSFNKHTPRDAWLKVTQEIFHFFEGAIKVTQRSLWMLGDALDFGEEAYGEEYAQAIDNSRAAINLSVSRIKNVMRLSKQFPAARRRVELTIGHHDAVARRGLDEKQQDKLLQKAVAESLSVAQLRDEVAEQVPSKSSAKKRSKAVKSEKDMTEKQAIGQANVVLSWCKAHEADLSGKWKGVLADFHKLYRRVFQA